MTELLAVRHPLEPLSGHTALYGDNKVDLRTTTDKISVRIRELALDYISLYGLKRITMQDVALACRISRAALYQRFSNKESLFVSIREYTLYEAFAILESAWIGGRGLGRNFADCLLGRDLYLFELINASPHGRDLLNSGGKVDISVDDELLTRSAQFLLQAMSDYPEAQFSAFDGADKMCQFASKTSFAIMLSGRDQRTITEDIEALCVSIEKAIAI